MRIRIKDKGYKKVCKLVDERDRHKCVICGRPDVQHHHIIFRSAGGDDLPGNLICLCPACHEIYAHGKKAKAWQGQFLEYVDDVKFDTFYAAHLLDVRDIIKRYGKTKKVRLYMWRVKNEQSNQ